MHCSAIFATLLASAALSSALGASPEQKWTLVTREPKGDSKHGIKIKPDFDKIKASDETWKRMADQCSKYKKSKSKRANTTVKVGESDYHNKVPLGLETRGLVTCYGIVITGKDGRGMLHMTASKATLKGQWDKFEGRIPKDLADKKGYVSYPDIKASEDKELANLNEQIKTEVFDLVEKIVKSAPIKNARVYAQDRESTMVVDADNTVTVDGTRIS